MNIDSIQNVPNQSAVMSLSDRGQNMTVSQYSPQVEHSQYSGIFSMELSHTTELMPIKNKVN
jgi:phospholipase C